MFGACGSGLRKDCRKKVCLARHIDDPPPTNNASKINGTMKSLKSYNATDTKKYYRFRPRNNGGTDRPIITIYEGVETETQTLAYDTDPQARRNNSNNKIEVTGLRNIGNSCSLNATLQALISAVPFTERVMQKKEIANGNTGDLINEIGSIITSIKAMEERYITPMKFAEKVKSLSNGQYGNGEQEDAHEFLTFLFDKLHEETKSDEGGKSIIEELFTGTMDMLLTCERCKKTRNKLLQG